MQNLIIGIFMTMFDLRIRLTEVPGLDVLQACPAFLGYCFLLKGLVDLKAPLPAKLRPCVIAAILYNGLFFLLLLYAWNDLGRWTILIDLSRFPLLLYIIHLLVQFFSAEELRLNADLQVAPFKLGYKYLVLGYVLMSIALLLSAFDQSIWKPGSHFMRSTTLSDITFYAMAGGASYYFFPALQKIKALYETLESHKENE